MRRICYSVAMSLDGFVAGPNGEADWILMDPEIDFGAMFARFDTALMGRLTYEAAQQMGSGSMPGIQTVVVSRTMRPEDHPGITILSEDLKEPLTRMRQASGKDIWLFGGGILFRSLLDLGLVDSIEVAIIPVLLGEGIPFLPHRSDRTRLKLTKTRTYQKTGIQLLEYAVVGG